MSSHPHGTYNLKTSADSRLDWLLCLLVFQSFSIIVEVYISRLDLLIRLNCVYPYCDREMKSEHGYGFICDPISGSIATIFWSTAFWSLFSKVPFLSPSEGLQSSLDRISESFLQPSLYRLGFATNLNTKRDERMDRQTDRYM